VFFVERGVKEKGDFSDGKGNRGGGKGESGKRVHPVFKKKEEEGSTVAFDFVKTGLEERGGKVSEKRENKRLKKRGGVKLVIKCATSVQIILSFVK